MLPAMPDDVMPRRLNEVGKEIPEGTLSCIPLTLSPSSVSAGLHRMAVQPGLTVQRASGPLSENIGGHQRVPFSPTHYLVVDHHAYLDGLEERQGATSYLR